MEKLSSHEVLILLVQILVLLVTARFFGEVFKRFKQPAVVGELFGGIILGPTFIGSLQPELFHELFFAYPKATIAVHGLFSIAVIMLLFVAGMEIELPLVWRNGKSALIISFIGIIIPFALGYLTGNTFFNLFDPPGGSDKFVFSLFLGTALSITALPVIAKILLDLNLLNSKIGGLIIACAILDDFVGWVLFSIVLSLMPNASESESPLAIWQVVALTLAFAVFMLTIFKILLDRFLMWVTRRLVGPGGAMTIAIVMCFVGAVITEAIGIHPVFGAFLMGVAFGESVHFSERSKEVIHQFVTNIFAPLFFVSVGLKVDFIKNFDLLITLLILAVAFISKITGGYLGGKAGGLTHRESMAIGFGINARGAMEIILATIALQAGLIGEPIFVALTIMAILTSITSGHFIRLFVKT
ncbi:MAG: cation:proton antiporter [Bacteroidia bacterium]